MSQLCAKDVSTTVQYLEIIQGNMKYSGKMVLIATVLFLMFGAVIAYAILRIVESVRFYRQRNVEFIKMKNKALSKNITYDSRNDNDPLVNRDEEDASKMLSDQKQISASIQNSVKAYKEYNDKMDQYYKEKKGGEEAPDKIDKNIILKEHDNYVKPQAS